MKRCEIKKLTVILLSVGLSILFQNPTLASPKIANGVSCLKSGQVTKLGNKVYRCYKNPFVKSSRLTWTLRECVSANELLLSAKEQYESFKDLANLAGDEGKKAIAELETTIMNLESSMKNQLCRRGA